VINYAKERVVFYVTRDVWKRNPMSTTPMHTSTPFVAKRRYDALALFPNFKCIVLFLGFNAFYGLILTVLHALMLGDHTNGWWVLQLLDLDISFGHGMGRFTETASLILGIFYGAIILVWSLVTLSASIQDQRCLQYAMPLGYFQLVILFILCLCKSFYICSWEERYYPMFESSCGPLVYGYILRSIFGILCTTIALRSLIVYSDFILGI